MKSNLLILLAVASIAFANETVETTTGQPQNTTLDDTLDATLFKKELFEGFFNNMNSSFEVKLKECLIFLGMFVSTVCGVIFYIRRTLQSAFRRRANLEQGNVMRNLL